MLLYISSLRSLFVPLFQAIVTGVAPANGMSGKELCHCMMLSRFCVEINL